MKASRECLVQLADLQAGLHLSHLRDRKSKLHSPEGQFPVSPGVMRILTTTLMRGLKMIQVVLKKFNNNWKNRKLKTPWMPLDAQNLVFLISTLTIPIYYSTFSIKCITFIPVQSRNVDGAPSGMALRQHRGVTDTWDKVLKWKIRPLKSRVKGYVCVYIYIYIYIYIYTPKMEFVCKKWFILTC